MKRWGSNFGYQRPKSDQLSIPINGSQWQLGKFSSSRSDVSANWHQPTLFGLSAFWESVCSVNRPEFGEAPTPKIWPYSCMTSQWLQSIAFSSLNTTSSLRLWQHWLSDSKPLTSEPILTKDPPSWITARILANAKIPIREPRFETFKNGTAWR